MDRIIDIVEIVQREVGKYNQNVEDYKAEGYFLEDNEKKAYAIMIVPDFDHPKNKKPHLMMMARIVDNHILIHADTTDRPLYEALLRCGIPREQIVLVYAGETIPPSGDN
jgi:XisI protein